MFDCHFTNLFIQKHLISTTSIIHIQNHSNTSTNWNLAILSNAPSKIKPLTYCPMSQNHTTFILSFHILALSSSRVFTLILSILILKTCERVGQWNVEICNFSIQTHITNTCWSCTSLHVISTCNLQIHKFLSTL